jgi:chemotaxis signal transduction protein
VKRARDVASKRESVSNSAVVAEAGTHVPAALPWVVFSCEGRQYGVPLECVSEIITPRPFTRLPGAGPEVCGLAGVRGRVVTVFDLGAVLGLRRAATFPDHRLLLMDLGLRRIGGAVEDVVDIAPARVEREAGAAGVVGTGYMTDAEFTALDPHMLLGRLLPG